MANLDTVAKRRSGHFISNAWRTSLPIPDGTIGQGDRQQIAYIYSGILASNPAASSAPVFVHHRKMQGAQ